MRRIYFVSYLVSSFLGNYAAVSYLAYSLKDARKMQEFLDVTDAETGRLWVVIYMQCPQEIYDLHMEVAVKAEEWIERYNKKAEEKAKENA